MTPRLTFAILGLAICGTTRAGSITIDISATQYGCSSCNGPQNILPGTTLNNIYAPKLQLTLGPGTYIITNGDTTIGDTFSAWNFQGPISNNWTWAFVVANDANSQVLLDDYINPGVYSTQALAAGAAGITTMDGNTVLTGTSTAGFTDTLVLASTTTLDFLIDDYSLADNAGGVALTITGPGIGSSVPEPSSFVPLGIALLILGRKLSRRF